LILVIIAIIGGTGYYVWHSKQQADKTLINTSNVSQPSSTHAEKKTEKTQNITLGTDVSFKVPENWHTAQPGAICNLTDNPIQCTDSVEASPFNAQEAKNGDAFGVSVGRFSTPGGMTAKSWFFDKWCGCLEVDDWTDQSINVNGYDAIKTTQSNSQYVDVHYVIRSGQVGVLIFARIKDTSTTAVQTGTTKDYTSYNSQIQQIASSVIIGK
jgi:hypothetical protein